MKSRSTLIVAVIALGLGAYVYLHEIRGGRARERARSEAASLLGIDAAAVTAVRIVHTGTLFELQKSPGGWVLRRPLPAPCDPRLVAAFLDTLAAARREEDVGRGDPVKYGLDAPAAQLEVDAGGRTRKLALGHINPLQTLVYVQVDGDDDVLLTTSALLSFALQNDFGWRDKRMIDVDPDTVERLAFTTIRDGDLTLRRDPVHGWRVEGAVAWRADPVRVRSMLQALARLECVGVAAENKTKLGDFGLGGRQLSAVVEGAGGRRVGDLTIGFADGKGAYFAIVPDKPEVFRVDGRVVDGWVALVREPRDRKALPPFLPDDITRLQVRTPDDAFVLERRSAVDWRVVASQRADSTFAIATGAVDALLADLATLEAAGWPERQPATGSFDPPTIQVLLFAGERQVSGLDVGTRDRSGINLFARAPGEPAVFWLSPADLLRLPFDLERLRAEERPAPEGADRG